MIMSDLYELYSEPTSFEEAEVVDEATGKKAKKFTVEAVVQKADVPNKNNRVYPRAVLEREVARFQTMIDESHAFGEADHPDGMTSSVARVAAVFTKIWMEDDGTVKAKAVIPETQVGKDVQAIIRAGGRPGWSSRGAGSVDPVTKDGVTLDVVQEDFRLKTFDCVINQSVPGAVTQKATMEQEIGSMKLTLESLKADHSDVYEAVKAEIEKTFEESLEEKILARLETEKGQIEETIRAEMKESVKAELPALIAEATKGPDSLLLTIAHLLAESGYAPEGALLSDEEGNEEIAKLETENETLKKRLDEVETKLNEQDNEKDAEAAKARIASLTEGVPHGKLIAERLDGCETVAEVEKAFPVIKEAIDALTEELSPDGEKLKGKGAIPEATAGAEVEPEKLDEVNRQRKAAGLSPLKG